MNGSAKKVSLASVDDLFSTEKERREADGEKVVRLSLSEMHPYKGYPALMGLMPRNQPYQVRDDDPTMIQLVARVKARGVRVPALVRPDPEGGYEIIAGQRRHRASEISELADMPAIIREMTDEEAAAELVDSNINREDLLPSERAWAYRLRLEVEKRQGVRSDLTSPHDAAKFRSDDEIGKSLGISGDTLRRYASLTELVPELMELVDNKTIGVTPASVLSALRPEEQTLLLDAMDYAQATPSVAQAQRLKKFSQEGHLSIDAMRAIMSEEKKSEKDELRFTGDTLRKYFPKSYTPQKMEETIIKLLEQWQRKRQQQQER